MALNIVLQNDSSNTPRYFLSFREVIDGMINWEGGKASNSTLPNPGKHSWSWHLSSGEIVTGQGETG